MKNKQLKRILKLLFIGASLSSLFFVPWILVKAWITPLPDTVQEQVNESIEYGFDGMIVYVDQAGKQPAFYSGGWNDVSKSSSYPPTTRFGWTTGVKLDQTGGWQHAILSRKVCG